MVSFLSLLGAAAALIVVVTGVQAAPPHKCIVSGKVTYQQGPCPSGQVRPPPTVEELNAAEKKRRAAAATAAPAEKPSSASTLSPASPAAASGFRCDGRQYCSQMTSCAEAKHFSAYCPGVKMDGDNNGVPCEQQWCRP